MSKLLTILHRIWGLVPRALPTNAADHEVYFQRLVSTYGIPDQPGFRQAFGTFIMHLKPTVFCASPAYFAKCLKKAQANEAAYNAIQEVKEQQKKQNEAIVKSLTSVKPGEATPTTAELADAKAVKP